MRLLAVLAAALIVAGTVSLTLGAYLPAKAALAQQLLRRAWVHPGSDPAKPWPWAHTWPVGRLEIPSLGLDQIVLAGAEGSALAFGPGNVDGTAQPGEPGNIVIAGHRDTAFRFLGRLKPEDEIWLESRDHTRRCYIVEDTEVVHERETRVLAPTRKPTLTLVTCYPLDADRPGGALRYVVRAVEGASGDLRQSALDSTMSATLSTSRHAAVGGTSCSSTFHLIDQ